MTGRKRVRRAPRKRALAGVAAAVGVIGVASLVTGWGVSPVETSELAPAEIVALRFPDDWNDEPATTASASAPVATFALASTGSRPVDTSLMFSPYQSYPGQMTAQPLAYAAPTPQPPSAMAQPSEPSPEANAAAAPTRAAPAPRPAPRARKESAPLFNDAQLASIKSRLRLTAEQERYWPEVASALRGIGARIAQAHQNGSKNRAADIDPNGEEVQRLKSAAFPLIMSMSDEQKREVRMLAQVMGLQQVAASF